MNIRAEKREVVYAHVVRNGWDYWDYRVYPDGTVMKWDVWDYVHMGEYEDGYDEIKAAGLEVLK